MAERVVFHIGTMKSGTTFIQNVLKVNKPALMDAGVLYPGPRWRAQVKAAREIIGYGGRLQPALPADGAWERLATEIREWPGTAVVSMEYLAPRSVAQIQRMKKSFPDARVEAVMTARDLGRNVPAMWLEAMQNGGTASWEDYLASVRAKKDIKGPAVRFWRHQDVTTISERWTKALGSDAFTIVTVPPPGAPSDLLWQRFSAVLGIDPDLCKLEVPRNPGIGLASAMLLLELNRQYRQRGDELPAYYDRLVKQGLSKRGLAQNSASEPRLGFDEKWVRRIADAHIDSLRKAGYRVVGDLAELQPVAVKGVQPREVTPQQLLAAGAAAIDAALVESQRRPGAIPGQAPVGKARR